MTLKQVTSPPWNSKEMVWASRWSVALRAFYRQILSLTYSFFSLKLPPPACPGTTGNLYPQARLCQLVVSTIWFRNTRKNSRPSDHTLPFSNVERHDTTCRAAERELPLWPLVSPSLRFLPEFLGKHLNMPGKKTAFFCKMHYSPRSPIFAKAIQRGPISLHAYA